MQTIKISNEVLEKLIDLVRADFQGGDGVNDDEWLAFMREANDDHYDEMLKEVEERRGEEHEKRENILDVYKEWREEHG